MRRGTWSVRNWSASTLNRHRDSGWDALRAYFPALTLLPEPSITDAYNGHYAGRILKCEKPDVAARPQAGMTLYLDQTATATAIVVAILLTDHLFSPIGTTVKQLAVARAQLVQKPCALSLHVPALLLPASARGSRVIFPSGVKVILNLTPLKIGRASCR